MFPNNHGWRYPQPPPRDVELNRNSPQAKGLLIWAPLSAIYNRSPGVLKNWTHRTGDSSTFGSPTSNYDPIVGPYLAFPSTPAGFDWGDIPQVEGIDQITVSAWARKTGANWGQDMIWAKHTSASNGCFFLSTTTQTNLRFTVINASSSRVDNDATFTFNTQTWYHMVGVYNGVDLRIYINGILSSTPSAQTGLIKDHTSTLRLADFNGSGWDLEGDIAEPRIYDRALSAGEVWAMYDPATRWDLYKPQPQILWSIPIIPSQTILLDTLTLSSSVPSATVIPGGATITLDALTLSSSVPSFSVSVTPDHSRVDHIQTTFNLPRSVRSKHVDGKLAGIDYADRQHSDTSKGKL